MNTTLKFLIVGEGGEGGASNKEGGWHFLKKP